MTSFASWLHDLQTTDPYLTALKTFATTNAATWPFWSEKQDDYKAVIKNGQAANEEDLLQGLTIAFERWTAAEKAASSGWGFNLGKLGLILFGFAFLGVLVAALFLPDFYQSLARIDQVRGMVTFFFVLATTGIIVLFAITIFFIDKADEVGPRFNAAKDLLTIVIGVLGTIMGFYFGSATGGPANFALSNVAVAPLSVQAGKIAKLSGKIGGGTKPYTYSVVFSDPTGEMDDTQLAKMGVVKQKTEDGSIDQSITAPDVKNSKLVVFVLSASDAKDVSTQTSGALFLTPKTATPPGNQQKPK